jgi:hypothetical protein
MISVSPQGPNSLANPGRSDEERGCPYERATGAFSALLDKRTWTDALQDELDAALANAQGYIAFEYARIIFDRLTTKTTAPPTVNLFHIFDAVRAQAQEYAQRQVTCADGYACHGDPLLYLFDRHQDELLYQRFASENRTLRERGPDEYASLRDSSTVGNACVSLCESPNDRSAPRLPSEGFYQFPSGNLTALCFN